MIRLIGRRRTKEINLIGALQSARRGVEWGLFNRVIPDEEVDAELERLIEVLLVKNQQTLRQLKFTMNKECRRRYGDRARLRGLQRGRHGRGELASRHAADS